MLQNNLIKLIAQDLWQWIIFWTWKFHKSTDVEKCFFSQQIRQSSKESTGSSDTDSSSDDESSIQAPSGPPEPSDKVQQAKETEAGAEISALVNYVQPVHFSSFENSESEFIQMKIYELWK